MYRLIFSFLLLYSLLFKLSGFFLMLGVLLSPESVTLRSLDLLVLLLEFEKKDSTCPLIETFSKYSDQVV